MKRLTKYFLEGLLFLVPLYVTLYVIYFIFVKIDGFLQFETKGLGFAVTLLVITVVGFVSSNFLTRRLVDLVDAMFRKLPLAKMIYTSSKDLISALVGDKKRFKRPVLVEIYPGTGIKVAGFVTAESLKKFGLSENVAVYLPQSYNFAGYLIIVPKAQITPLNIESGHVMSFIVSGGVATTGKDLEEG